MYIKEPVPQDFRSLFFSVSFFWSYCIEGSLNGFAFLQFFTALFTKRWAINWGVSEDEVGGGGAGILNVTPL